MHHKAFPAGYELHWYRIEKVLGQGGFGITYLATDTNLDQHVAIKEYFPTEFAVRSTDMQVLPASHELEEKFRWGLTRFISEARTLSHFHHHNVARVYSVFELNNTAYMVMRYESGKKLGDILELRKTLPESELKGILYPILDGLREIHAGNFIHRDIQPNNIYVRDDGSPVLLDFGSARESGFDARTVTILVSPGYTPFEQYYDSGDQQGVWTDIYSLGATLYRAVAGVSPQDAIARSKGLLGSTEDVLVPAVEVGKGRYSERFLRAIDHALMFSEKDRPQSLDEWMRDFEDSAEMASGQEQAAGPGPSVRSPPPARGTPAVKPESGGQSELRSSRWVPVIFVLLVVAIGLAVYLLQRPAGPGTAPSSAGSIEPLDEPPAKLAPTLGATAPVPEVPAKEQVPNKLQRVAILLDAAGLALADGRLDRPHGDNALERFREALQIDPGSAAARRGIDRVFGELQQQANEALLAGDLALADGLVRRAALVDPDNAQLAEVRQKLEAEQTEQARIRYLEAELQRSEQALARRIAEEDARRKAEEEAQRQAEEQEARRKAEEEARRQAEEQEARRRAAEKAGAAARQKRVQPANAAPRDNALQLSQGLAAFDDGDYSAAYRKLKPLADKGNAEAALKMGVMQLYGLGIEADPGKALERLRFAEQQGLAGAPYYLGVMYALGKGVARDESRAFEWYRRGAERGHDLAQLNLGLMYAKGEGVPRDDAKAFGWYRKGAKQGNVDAFVNIAHMYAAGKGVVQNDFQSWAWFNLAVMAGDDSARYQRDLVAKKLQDVELKQADKLSRKYASMYLKQNGREATGK